MTTDAITVRRMQPDEAVVAQQLFESVVSQLTYYNQRAREEELAKYTAPELRAMIAEDPDSVLVAVAANDIVGICLNRYDDATIWLSWFCTHPQWRQRGIGSALLHALEATASARKCHKVWCDTRVSNDASATVLRRHGFVQITTITNHWYGQDFHLWHKVVS